jgi:hypothetical protein
MISFNVARFCLGNNSKKAPLVKGAAALDCMHTSRRCGGAVFRSNRRVKSSTAVDPVDKNTNPCWPSRSDTLVVGLAGLLQNSINSKFDALQNSLNWKIKGQDTKIDGQDRKIEGHYAKIEATKKSWW